MANRYFDFLEAMTDELFQKYETPLEKEDKAPPESEVSTQK